MGQAKARGTREERVAAALERKKQEIARRIEIVQKQPVHLRRRQASALGVLAFATALGVEM